MRLFPVVIAVLVPLAVAGFVLWRLWMYGDAGLERPDGNLSDPNDLMLTKLHLDDPPPSRSDGTLL
jgi:hypothetical protein